MGIGVILALIAGISGQDTATLALSKMTLLDMTRNLMDTHKRFASFTTWGSLVFFMGWIWIYFKNPGDRRVDYIALVFLFLLFLSLGIVGFLGVELVMQYGVNVGL